MTPPLCLFSPPELYYDSEQQICSNGGGVKNYSQDVVEPNSSVVLERQASYFTLSDFTHQVFGEIPPPSSGGSLLKLLRNTNPLALLLGTSGCVDVTEAGLYGRPFQLLEAEDQERAFNEKPILGKLRSGGLGVGAGDRMTVTWSVIDPVDPSQHGTFAFTQDANSVGDTVVVNPSPQLQIQTATALLDDSSSVVLMTQTTGDGPGDVASFFVQRLAASGQLLGTPVEILPEAHYENIPQGQIISTPRGFLVVFTGDAEHLIAREFDVAGQVLGEIDLGEVPQRFRIARGGDQWVLAQSVGSQQILVRTFSGLEFAGIQKEITGHPFPNSDYQISVALQPDEGGMMVAWNAMASPEHPILEGIFLNAQGLSVGPVKTLRSNTLSPAKAHVIASDGWGNFFLIFEMEGTPQIQGYNGNYPATTGIPFLVPSFVDRTGAYGEILEDVQDPSLNVEGVSAEFSPEGVLRLAYLKIFTGRNSQGEVVSVQQVAGKSYRIVYDE